MPKQAYLSSAVSEETSLDTDEKRIATHFRRTMKSAAAKREKHDVPTVTFDPEKKCVVLNFPSGKVIHINNDR